MHRRLVWRENKLKQLPLHCEDICHRDNWWACSGAKKCCNSLLYRSFREKYLPKRQLIRMYWRKNYATRTCWKVASQGLFARYVPYSERTGIICKKNNIKVKKRIKKMERKRCLWGRNRSQVTNWEGGLGDDMSCHWWELIMKLCLIILDLQNFLVNWFLWQNKVNFLVSDDIVTFLCKFDCLKMN